MGPAKSLMNVSTTATLIEPRVIYSTKTAPKPERIEQHVEIDINSGLSQPPSAE